MPFTVYFLCLLSNFDETIYKMTSYNGAIKSVLFLRPQKDIHLTSTMKPFSILRVKNSSVQYCTTSQSAPFCNLLLLKRRQESNCGCDGMRRVSSAVSSETAELHRPSTKWGTGDCTGRRCGTWRRKAPYCTRVCGVVCRATSLLSDFLQS